MAKFYKFQYFRTNDETTKQMIIRTLRS
ncbi:unnamed protein product [Acanthoscelides obtectus]|uniref:Uncharacterized protein n=1 Tax=Acanthoscelides obtectus TaxID=200917 RepID=A0A9P0LAW4_ACAOB|nr:unnamed protein product [Acanthoscelides obtectus]CAH2000961.1 unnamed protein product [Acanthoscelides obtectus]CAK1649661.1 hypothetical protein AOBTE_LOCUS16348 [Acanthoscelides obtectus]CAK1649695.1 hypothetical protein AOBTE_LOCUS16360 [Acanthoscelides obtectus]